MELDKSLLKEFAKTAAPKPQAAPKQYSRGTISIGTDTQKYVKLDGSEMLTPITGVVDYESGDRVLVSIENHQATVLGNFTFPPSARKEQQALDQSTQAQTQSNKAQQLAQSASQNASTAITQSSAANALANEAKTEAAGASQAAAQASQNATAAQTEAANANKQSAAAQTAANEAKHAVSAANNEISKLNTEVTNVKTDISGALTDLGNQAKDIQTIKTTYSTKVETEAVKAALSTEITQKVGELSTSISQTYAAKTDLVSMEGKLQTQITQNAEGLSTQATKVDKLQADTSKAQQDVNTALANAAKAQTSADAAKTTADAAQAEATLAKTNAATAQTKADNAQLAADNAQKAVDAADRNLAAAKTDLAEAKQNLLNVTNRVGATEKDIADAQAKVNAAQTAVDGALVQVAEAKTAANKAQTDATKAQNDAATAQSAATQAQTKADNAKQVADNAAADALKAQQDVAALTNRVSTAETKITQNSEAITLQATKTTEISNKVDGISIGGRNLVLSSNIKHENDSYLIHKYATSQIIEEGTEVTIQIKGTLGKGKTHFSIYSFNGSCQVVDLIKPDADGIYRAKAKWRYKTWDGVDVAPAPEVNVYAIPSNIVCNNSIEWIKIEKGNKATDWTPAPEDIQNELTNNYYNKTQADAAIKVASDNIKLGVSETYITKVEGTDISKAANTALDKANSAETNSSNALNKVDDLEQRANSGEFKGEDAVVLHILSSNGNSFKNSSIATTLTVTIVVAGVSIGSAAAMRTKFGPNAKILWEQKSYGETVFTPLSPTDPRLSDDGFILTLTSNDVKTQAVFNCSLDY